MQHNR